MEEKDIVALSKEVEKKLEKRYKDPILCNQYAWWMIEQITGKERATLVSLQRIHMTKEQIATLDKWIDEQIHKKVPLQYLLGSVPFDDIEILVESPVLIPRPETEELCYKIIDQLNQLEDKKLSILDIGTGSGCIALTLAKHFPQATVVATDVSDQALALAEKNAKHNNIKNVTFLKSDVYDNIKKEVTFDFIVSNPPYIAPDEWKELDESVTKWEDKHALVTNKEGLAIIERIVLQAPKHIKQNQAIETKEIPQLIIEIGYKQGQQVAQLFEKAGFIDIHVEKDLEQKDRFVSGRIK